MARDMFRGNGEFQLICAARGRGGWAGERPQMPFALGENILKKLPVPLAPEREHEFKQFLRLIFANAVETEHCRQSYRSMMHRNMRQPAGKIHLGSGRVQKFPNVAAAALAKLHGEYLGLRRHRHVSDPCMTRFLRRVSRDPGAFGLLDLALRTSGNRQLRLCDVPHLRSDIFNGLGAAFEGAHEILAAMKKPGPSDPVYEQLARALAQLYFQFVGKRPGRGYDPVKNIDTGRFLCLCQTMASAVNDALPADLKRPAAAKMAKVVRRMIDELKADLEVA